MPIIAGCKTTQTVVNLKEPLPPKPQRETIQTGTSLVEILIYYEALVQKWELWSIAVEDIYNDTSN